MLKPLNYQNLDALPQFKGVNTTTEVMAHHIFDEIAKALATTDVGRPYNELARLCVTLSESHVARARYEAALPVVG